MIVIHPVGGRFGNIIHQYAYGLTLHKHTGYAFNWTKHNVKYNDIFWQYFPNMTDKEGKVYNRLGNRINDRHSTTKIIDLQLKPQRKIEIKGNFEMAGLYNKVQHEYIKDTLTPIQHLDKDNPAVNMFRNVNGNFQPIPTRAIDKEDIVLHFRTGDLVNFCTTGCPYNSFLDFEYFNQILSKIKFQRLYIVTEQESFIKSFADIFLAKFQGYKPIYVSGELIDDFNFIRLFDRIITSQSSFSYWAGYLSNASKVYVPVTKCGPWNKYNIWLRIPNERRFERVFEDFNGTIMRHKYIIKYLLRR